MTLRYIIKINNLEDGKMKTVFYLNGKKATRKALNELLGRAVVREMVLYAKERRIAKSLMVNVFIMGSYGTLTVCFV